jgi:hypothetical protein
MEFSVGICDSCGQPAKERTETATGRRVCQSCADDLSSTSAALMIGGGVGHAVAIRGWLRRARSWRLRGRP